MYALFYAIGSFSQNTGYWMFAKLYLKVARNHVAENLTKKEITCQWAMNLVITTCNIALPLIYSVSILLLQYHENAYNVYNTIIDVDIFLSTIVQVVIWLVLLYGVLKIKSLIKQQSL